MDEYIFQRRDGHIDAAYINVGQCQLADQAGSQRLPMLSLHINGVIFVAYRASEFLLKQRSSSYGVGSSEADLILTNHAFESRRRIDGDDLAVINNGDAIAIFSFFHIVRRHKDGQSSTFAQFQHMFPDATSCLRIKAHGWLIQK